MYQHKYTVGRDDMNAGAAATVRTGSFRVGKGRVGAQTRWTQPTRETGTHTHTTQNTEHKPQDKDTPVSRRHMAADVKGTCSGASGVLWLW